MTKNFKFCNEDFLPLFCYKPAPFYNQFNLEKQTKLVLDSMGEHPDYHLVFKYNPEKRIRATFIVFDDEELENLDVKCICVLFHGHRLDSYCYFYEVYDDSTIGCIQVAKQFDDSRIVLEMNVGTDIDKYFDKLCSMFGKPSTESITMLYYKDDDDCFRLLDMILSELSGRCLPLLGGAPIIENITINNTNFIIYKSKENMNYLIARTVDGKNPSDIMLSDIEILK